ncbi:MAG: cupredoxin domain-containing protein [Acidimicrobiales bacterium]
MRRVLSFIGALTALIVLAAACSSDGDGEVATGDSSPDTTAGSAEIVVPETTTTAEPAATLPDYTDELADVELVGDTELPADSPEAPTGSTGFSRYVYTQTSTGEIIPTLVEGPAGRQVRCQEAEQLCSYPELKELYDSGDEIPDYLDMDRETLGELVGQLDRVNDAVTEYTNINLACERGFSRSTNQTANMGIHMIDNGAQGFDPDRPQMILFAKEDGVFQTGAELGTCAEGVWTGDDDFKAVGAVFNLDLTDEHPDGFAGPIDNWHIHYNTCIAPREGSDSAGSREACREAGGLFLPRIGSWMMHAYVADGFEADAGVFSMFNPNVWPIVDGSDELFDRGLTEIEGAVNAPIANFDYGDITAGVGESIVFSNSDAVPHTVTSGSALDPTSDFDSGVLGTGQTFELSFDEAGQYPLFCVLHPDMQATVTVQ